jgi:hypothetical protein
MKRDYEDTHNIDELDDSELRALVREQLEAHAALDIDELTVKAADGHVLLTGRVGTDGERQIAEHILTDVLGIERFTNDIVVDQLARAESPQAIDDHLADEEERSGTLLGDVAVPLSPEAGHLADRAKEDLTGTTDYEKVMEEGMTWNPPDGPTPEGFDSDQPGGERH